MAKILARALPLVVVWSAVLLASAGRIAGAEAQYVQTSGGLLVHQDVRFFGEWRVQQNRITGTFRLLDPQSVCRASGTRAECESAFAAFRTELELPPVAGRVLVLLHGFGANRLMLQNMAAWFRREGGYSCVVNITYPSMFVGLEEQSGVVGCIVAQLDGAERVDFVGHSLGAIILRHYLAHDPDPRVGRLVQLCPPNRGSAQAERVGSGAFTPAAVRDLAEDPSVLQEWLGVPKCPFGIIAGGCGDGEGYAPGLAGDDDRVISVEDTQLDGAADFLLLNGDHSEIPNSVETFEHVRHFLDFGTFGNGG